MAKRARAKQSPSGRAGSQPSRRRVARGRTVEDKIIEYAEELGRAIGAVRTRMDTWQGERQQLINQLSTAVDEAKNLLADLGQRAQRTGQQLASRARQMAGGGARRRTAAKVPRRTAGGPDRERHSLPATTRRKLARARRK